MEALCKEKPHFCKRKPEPQRHSLSRWHDRIYKEYITVRDILLEAYDYVVNGKSAIE